MANINANASRMRVGFVVSAVVLIGIWMVSNRWKTDDLVVPSKKENLMGTISNATPQKEVTRIEFINEVLDGVKPTPLVARVLTSTPGNVPKDSMELAFNWAIETQNPALATLIRTDIDLISKNPNYTDIARTFIFNGDMYLGEKPIVASYLFQQGKKYIDKGLQINPKNISLLNALIVYESEYVNQPMQFRNTLKQALALDSNNIETNIIHLNLLKKSGQLPKALKKCEKLISLQPQNSDWLFEMSNLYGTAGDSVNAKVYLNLAIKTQKRNNK
jgi:hypothetical protein